MQILVVERLSTTKVESEEYMSYSEIYSSKFLINAVLLADF